MTRRHIPSLLLAVLAVGAALGAGLGLAEGPLTSTAAQATATSVQCSVTHPTPKATVVTCETPETFRVKELANGFSTGLAVSVYFLRVIRIPAGFARCLTNAMEPIWPDATSSVSRLPAHVMLREIAACGAPTTAPHTFIVS